MSGAKPADYHGSCSFLSIYLFWNVSFCFYLCFGTHLIRFGAKEIFKKEIFSCVCEALKVFRIYRCHPVHGMRYYRSQRPIGYSTALIEYVKNWCKRAFIAKNLRGRQDTYVTSLKPSSITLASQDRKTAAGFRKITKFFSTSPMQSTKIAN
jgi:hypothetical protein